MKHAQQWQHQQSAWRHHRFPHAQLFIGPQHDVLEDFATHVSKLVLCAAPTTQAEPCLECKNCRMLAAGVHPDMEWIRPEKNPGPIKIDQIRRLQETAYLTPQCAKYRVIAITAADRMNTAAANALLKILEEPAQHSLFLLLAEQVNTVLPTVLSRCSVLRFSLACAANPLLLGTEYPEDSDKGRVVKQSEAIVGGLVAVLEHAEHPCRVAAAWSEYDLGALLWFLYVVFAHMQITLFIKTPISDDLLTKLSTLLDPVLVFAQLDALQALTKKLQHNAPVNPALALENLLFALQRRRVTC